MAKDPESLGTGLGSFLADYLPLMPSGARRAGAARVMAARIGRDPSFLVEHPIKTQLLAMGLGGVGATYADRTAPLSRALIGVAPWLIVQALRRHEIKDIQGDYDEKKRKRLRELDEEALFDNGLFGLGGSSRLGATQAYETMRKRKYQDLSSLAETSDIAQMLANSVGLGAPSAAVLGGLDNLEARRLRKQADFSEQRNSPAIPLYLLAGLLSSAGQSAASTWAHERFKNAPPMDPGGWGDLVRHTSKSNPLIYSASGMNNAFYGKPRNEAEAEMFLRFLDAHPNVEREQMGERAWRKSEWSDRGKRLQRLMRYGAVMADDKASAGVIAHEGGHARIEEHPGVLRFLQRHLYPNAKLIAPLAGVGSMAAGLASGGPIRGALLGTGIGLLGGAGMVGPEIGASYYGKKGLKGFRGGALTGRGETHDLLAALSTYLAGTVLPSTLSGAAGGYISGRRKKKRREQEKEANVSKLWPTIRRIRELRALGPDAAFRHAVDTIGKSDVVAEKMFFGAPEIKALGITKRTPDKTIAQLIKQLSEPKAQPRNWTVPQRPGAQGTLDLFKDAKEHPELQTMIQAKAHSDQKQYVDKNRLIAQAMRRDPEAFIIDSDDGQGIVGITHVPTGFKIHMLKSQVDPGVQVAIPAAVAS